MNLFPYAFAVLFFTGVILLKRACDQEVKDGEKVKNVRFGGARGLLAVEYISLALLALIFSFVLFHSVVRMEAFLVPCSCFFFGGWYSIYDAKKKISRLLHIQTERSIEHPKTQPIVYESELQKKAIWSFAGLVGSLMMLSSAILGFFIITSY